jgi:aminoglycoside phosphotransferase (APT) family kinase protein
VIEADGAVLRPRVARLAAERFGAGELGDLRALPGGHSGITWATTFMCAVCPGRHHHIVIKSTPAGRDPVGRHDVLRQARVTRAIRAAGDVPVPVPEVLFADEEAPQFYAMEHVPGISEEPVLDGAGETGEQMGALWDQAVELLVALSAADPVALGLVDGEPVFTPAQELARWQLTARAAGEEAEARSAPLAAALVATAPAAGRTALVHGDYRIGNTLRRDAVIRAVIDWEIWSLGDPRFDLGWLRLFTDASSFPGLGRQVAGIPDRDAVLARYVERSGAAVEAAEWFGALACFKLAAIQSHNLRRHREGRYRDDFLENFARSIQAVLERGTRAIS